MEEKEETGRSTAAKETKEQQEQAREHRNPQEKEKKNPPNSGYLNASPRRSMGDSLYGDFREDETVRNPRSLQWGKSNREMSSRKRKIQNRQETQNPEV